MKTPMRMKLSGLSLYQAGDWGLQTPENILFVVFFCGYAAKKDNKRGPGAAPQWEICVSFMRMGEGGIGDTVGVWRCQTPAWETTL